MVDIVDKNTRSRMMSGIRSRNTKPEILVRSLLHRLGFRFRLHDYRLPGRPDIILPRYRAVIFIHGCFWHGHNCPLFKWPGTHTDFWRNKINRNKVNDQNSKESLLALGWRVYIIWECVVRKAAKNNYAFANKLAAWLHGTITSLEEEG